LIEELQLIQESPDRVKHIKRHLDKFPNEFPISQEIQDFGLDPILAIHDIDYVNHLQTIFDEWYIIVI